MRSPTAHGMSHYHSLLPSQASEYRKLCRLKISTKSGQGRRIKTPLLHKNDVDPSPLNVAMNLHNIALSDRHYKWKMPLALLGAI